MVPRDSTSAVYYYLVPGSVLCVTVSFLRHFLIARAACTWQVSKNSVSASRRGGELGTSFLETPSRGSRGCRKSCGLGGAFEGGEIWLVCFLVLFFYIGHTPPAASMSLHRTHTACCKHEAALPRLPLYSKINTSITITVDHS